MLKLLPFTFKNLWRNRRRTVLTTLSVAISLFLLGFLMTVYAAFYAQPVDDDQARRLVVRHKVSLTQAMPLAYERRIAQIDGVEELVVMNWFGGIYIDQRPEHMFPRFAVQAEKVFDIFTELEISPDQREAFERDRQAIAIGTQVAERVGLKLGDRVTIKGDIYAGFDPELTVRAIFKGTNDFNSFFHYKYLDESLPDARQGVAGTFTIRLRSVEDADRVAKEVDAMFRNATEPTKTETEAAFAASFVEQLGNIKLFLLAIAGAVCFTIILVTANTVAMAVRERIREIGVMKTLGFRTGTVLGMILTESAIIAFFGGIIGVALALGATQALRGVLIGFIPGFGMPLWAVPICLGAAMVIGVGSSFFPALFAARTQTTDALRHTG